MPVGINKVSRNSQIGGDIPDAQIFDNPLYRFPYTKVSASDGQTGFALPETLAGLSDASAVGDPTYQSDKSGTPAGDYDGTDDGHDISSDSNAPSGSENFGFAALVWFKSTSDFDTILSFGNGATGSSASIGSNSGTLEFFILGPSYVTASGGTVPTGQWATIGGWTENSGKDAYGVLDGTQVSSETGQLTPSLSDTNHSIGYRRHSSDRYADVFVGDAIIMNGPEIESNYTTYHNEWMSILS